MHLNEIGIIAQDIWLKIPHQFPFIQLGAFIIMPNHIHGLLTVETQFIASEKTNASIQTHVIKNTTGGFSGIKNPLLNENISRVMRWYKGRCSFEIRSIHADFSWQSRFYYHIIRDQQSLKNIEEYISANPYNWNEDDFYKD